MQTLKIIRSKRKFTKQLKRVTTRHLMEIKN